MTENTGGSGSSAYPGSGGYGSSPQDPSYGGTPPAYGQSNPPAYGQGSPPPYGQSTGYGPGYGQGASPTYGSPDPNSYLGPPAYPGGGYGVPPPPPGFEAGQTGWNGFAIASFVTSLIPLIGILAAVPLGIVALVKLSKSHQKGRGLAIAGIVISVLWWIGFIILAVFLARQTVERNAAGQITKEGRIDFGQIRVGDCVKIPNPGGSGDVNTFELKGVPCSSGHNAETAAILPIASDTYPGSDALDSQTVGACQTRAQSYLAGSSVTGLQPYRLIPTESIWQGDNGHRVICFITRTDYSTMSGSLTSK